MTQSLRFLPGLAGAVFGVIGLTGCAGGPVPAEDLAASNPSAVFCIQQGGEFIIERQVEGAARGLCVKPDGSTVDAMEYFRANAPQPAEG